MGGMTENTNRTTQKLGKKDISNKSAILYQLGH